MLLRRLAVGFLLLLMLACTVPSQAADKLKALIVDGQNNHDWKKTTPILKQQLEESGLFTVEVATSPEKGKDLASFKPKFSDYAVVVSNYNGDLWGEPMRKDFIEYLKNGGGFVCVHAANNAFESWPEYNDVIGLGWRGPGFGDRLSWSDDGKEVRTAKGEGPGASHGAQHEFKVVVRDHEHPITKGLPPEWLHAKDELYHGQRGPAKDMTVLATAFSAKDKGGTGTSEPMLWVIPYGKGRVFVTLLGHADYSMKCVDFETTFNRGAEWAATGKVTQAAPANYPSADKVEATK